MILKLGDKIASEFGEGKIVAITKDWIIHEDEDGFEVAAHRKETALWVPVELEDGDIPCGIFDSVEINNDIMT